MKEYAVIYEHAGDGWSAYAPDVPGCIAAAGTLDETRSLFREALELHIERMRETGQPIPEPTTKAEVVSVAA